MSQEETKWRISTTEEESFLNSQITLESLLK